MTQITQIEINKAAWSACDTFRGVVDLAQNLLKSGFDFIIINSLKLLPCQLKAAATKNIY